MHVEFMRQRAIIDMLALRFIKQPALPDVGFNTYCKDFIRELLVQLMLSSDEKIISML